MELTKDRLGTKLELRFVNFQGVQELGIFIKENHGGGEETRVGKLAVYGEPVMQQGLKRSAEQQQSASKGDWLGKGIS